MLVTTFLLINFKLDHPCFNVCFFTEYAWSLHYLLIIKCGRLYSFDLSRMFWLILTSAVKKSSFVFEQHLAGRLLISVRCISFMAWIKITMIVMIPIILRTIIVFRKYSSFWYEPMNKTHSFKYFKKNFKICFFALPNAKIEKTEIGMAKHSKFK